MFCDVSFVCKNTQLAVSYIFLSNTDSKYKICVVLLVCCLSVVAVSLEMLLLSQTLLKNSFSSLVLGSNVFYFNSCLVSVVASMSHFNPYLRRLYRYILPVMN